ncbi:acyl-CoA dehydrogenase family protein [Rhizobium leguminosarum]|uniref:acyl-CoA dehydrogenase family protein n=1 Tax=Rhizobium leguminosarum TaxID=384 RepID=UPI003F96714B
MDFSYSDSQTLFQRSVERYCSENYGLSARALALNKLTLHDRKKWKEIGDLGWLGASLPLESYGSGGSIIEAAIILEIFGRHLVDLPYVEHALVVGHIVSRLPPTQEIEDLLSSIVSGEATVAFAHREIEGGRDLHFVQTSAKPTKEGKVQLNGRKSIVVGGPNVDQFIVSARTSGEATDRGGVSLFLLNRKREGMITHDYRLLDGTNACDLVLEDVQADSQCILGEDNSFEFTEMASDLEDIGFCAEALGIVESVLWMTRNYLRDRKQYGSTLASFQALQHRMADMFVEVELSRSTLFHALSMIGHSDRATRHANVLGARIRIGNSAKYVCKEAIQLHGAMGMVEDNLIGKYFKRICVVFGQKGGLDEQLDMLSSLKFDER